MRSTQFFNSGSLLNLPPPNMIARYAVEKYVKSDEMEWKVLLLLKF